MNYITSNIPYFKAWVRKEYTTNHDRYHGEFLHAMVIGVTTLPMRTLSFQVLFTGCEEEENVKKIGQFLEVYILFTTNPIFFKFDM